MSAEDGNTQLTASLSMNEWNRIIAALSKEPYGEVAVIINKLLPQLIDKDTVASIQEHREKANGTEEVRDTHQEGQQG